MLVFCCFCPAVDAQGGSLEELLAAQASALKTLEQKLAGSNPYLQWNAARQALKGLAASADEVARKSRQIERELGQSSADNQRVRSDYEALREEVQGLRRSNRELARASNDLADGNKELLVENEQLAAQQKYFWLAFYSALALAFIGFGGLLIRIPNSRLESRLKRLEIRELENKLKEETFRSQMEASRPRAAARPMAERRNSESKLSPSEPIPAEPTDARIKPTTLPKALRDLGPLDQPTASGPSAREKIAESSEQESRPDNAEKDLRKGEIRQKRKKKKKKSRLAAMAEA